MDQSQMQEFIRKEIETRMKPLAYEVAEVKRQNMDQSTALTLLTRKNDQQTEKIEKVDRWSKQLWSNGSGGPPGYLEIARKQDDERYDKLFKVITDLREAALMQKGKELLLQEQEEAGDKRIDKIKRYAGLATALGGAYVLNLMHPLLKSLMLYVAGLIK